MASDDVQKAPWEVPWASYNDPDIAPFAGPEPLEPKVLDRGCYWRLRPGEPLDEVTKLPRHHADQPVVFFGGPRQRLMLDLPHGRRILAVPAAPNGASDEVLARKIVVVYCRHRATGHINTPDRWLIVLNAAGQQLARLDFSESWELRADSLQRICDLAGMEFAVETYESERDLLAARPHWTPAHIELEVEHPLEADVRDFGMALWYGTGIAITLLGAAGMQLIFGTPVRYVVITAAVGGFIVASIIKTWSRIRWRKARLRRQQAVTARALP